MYAYVLYIMYSHILMFYQSFEDHIAGLHWCIGNAYRLEDGFEKPSVYYKNPSKLFQSQNDILEQVKDYVKLGKTYR